MELRRLAVEQLVPAPYNPRKPLVPGSPRHRRLERSLREFDMVQPIVWNEQTGHVVGGQQRLEILKQQGVTEIDVVVVSLTLDREKALNIALNNAQVGSDWDPDKLLQVVDELTALPDFDVTLTGFDARDLRDLRLRPAAPATTPAAEQADQHVQVTLEVPPDEWNDVRGELDEILSDYHIRVHVRTAQG